MPAHDSYNPDEMARRLEAWLATTLDGATGVGVTSLRAPGETGMSSETMMFDVAWTADGNEQSASLALRSRPTGHVVFPIYDLGMQYDVIGKVAAAAPHVPTPPLRWFEPSTEPIGREFFVMDLVKGDVPPDNLPYTMGGWLLDANPDQQRDLQMSSVDVLADIHAIDWRAAGLEVLDQPEYGSLGLDQQLGYYEFFLEWGRMGRPQPTLDRVAAWLRANQPSPEPDLVFNWGDSRIGNILFRDFAPVAVLDWEMATIGPREVDLAWFCLLERFFSSHLGVPNLPGFGSTDDVVAHYQQRTEYQVSDFGWYSLWASYRYAVVMMRIVQAAELAGDDIGFTEQDNVAVTLLETLESEIC